MRNAGDALTEIETELWMHLQERLLFPKPFLLLEDQENCPALQHSPQRLSGLRVFVEHSSYPGLCSETPTGDVSKPLVDDLYFVAQGEAGAPHGQPFPEEPTVHSGPRRTGPPGERLFA